MRKLIFLVFFLFAGQLCLFSQTDGDNIVIGKYRKLHSAVTNEDRTLLVWRPRSYDQTTLSYPVMYVLYGQNISGYMLPAITACDMLASSGVIPEMIIVGIANAERYRDYTSIADGYITSTGRNDEASELLEYQLALYPKSLNALMRMGDLKRSAGDYEGAIKYYDDF